MSHFSGVWAEAEKIYYLLTDSECPAFFLDNEHAYDTAKWLASKGVTVSTSTEPTKEDDNEP